MEGSNLADTISLDGTWQFSLGEEISWREIQVPGCWEAQGSSKQIDGPARYRRAVRIPKGWGGRRILLEFEAVSYACAVRWNGVEVGMHEGLWTPFTVDITGAAQAGAENVVELEIWKPGQRYPMRASLAGFLPDIATTFGGIWQPVHLSAVSAVLRDVSIRADYADRKINVYARADLPERATRDLLTWKLDIYQGDRRVIETETPYSPDAPLDASVSLPDALLWSPEAPNLYTVQIRLLDGSAVLARVARRVGFRRISADGAQLLLNGQPFMVRGVLSWGWQPRQVAPIYTREQAREEMRSAREMGFNLIKLCLVVPNAEYFEVADEEGMLLWAELPMWLPEVTNNLRARAPIEYEEIAGLLAGHPSIVLYSLGCELSQEVDGALIEALNRAVRGQVHDVLVCDNSGSGESYGGLDFDFADFTDFHPYYDLHFFEPLLDNWRRDWQRPRPWIFGEFCDSDTFRDLEEIIQANGGERPWWLTRDNPVTGWRAEAQAVVEWENRLNEAQPGIPVQELVRISYKQSYAIRKYTLEALRRRRGIGGYIITGLRDTPISTSGVWDDLGRAKWPAEAFSQINGKAVLALDVVRRRVWRSGGDRPDRVDPYNHWAGARVNWFVILNDSGVGFLAGSQFTWSLVDLAGVALASGTQKLARDVEQGIPTQVGSIQVHLPRVGQAAELRLRASIQAGERCVQNEWPVWVYPQPAALPAGLAVYDPSGVLSGDRYWLADVERIGENRPHPVQPAVLVATALDGWVWEYLQAGGRVLLLQVGEAPLPVRRCPFWREAVSLFPAHPLWERFPQRGYTDMQFFGLACDLAFDTHRLAEALPPGALVRPIMRRLDARAFYMSEYLFEAEVGKGLLVGCALNLRGGEGAQTEGWNRNVAGGAMFGALVEYLAK